ncbi:MAG: HAMP domain-containing histidine kinase, partial [Muribaculaceae bacterium]|nr:HAMP domain-containing histidine kinase [Muribaculaceae bacterium]
YYNLTHIPEPKISRVEAKAFFNSLQKMVSHEIRQRGLDEESVSFTMPDGMMLNIDSALFTQVMNNLIRNALDAVAGRVGGCVEVVLTVSDGRPFIQINDNGEGMSESAKENLFQPFFSTKEDGSGVGLYISRQIVRKHGGELTVRSINGKGTFVSVGLMPTQE